MVALGHLALPWSEALPLHTPLQEQKWQKSAIFGFLYSPTPPHPNKNNLVQPLEKAISNLVLRLVKIFSGVKIHAI